MRFPAGTSVRVAMTKWGERPHWGFAAAYLGTDDHGEWLHIPAGTVFRRPGMEYVAPVDQVTLLPPPAAGWVATFHAAHGPVRLYVDITAGLAWQGGTVSCVDLDLDVLERPDGEVLVDDEDEFAEHRVAYGYPPEVVAAAEAACRSVHEAVLARRPPFDLDTAAAWLRLAAART